MSERERLPEGVKDLTVLRRALEWPWECGAKFPCWFWLKACGVVGGQVWCDLWMKFWWGVWIRVAVLLGVTGRWCCLDRNRVMLLMSLQDHWVLTELWNAPLDQIPSGKTSELCDFQCFFLLHYQPAACYTDHRVSLPMQQLSGSELWFLGSLITSPYSVWITTSPLHFKMLQFTLKLYIYKSDKMLKYLLVFMCCKVRLNFQMLQKRNQNLSGIFYMEELHNQIVSQTSFSMAYCSHWDLLAPQVSGTKKLVAATTLGAFSLLYLSRHFRRRKGKRRTLPPQWEPLGFDFQPLAAAVTGKALHRSWLRFPTLVVTQSLWQSVRKVGPVLSHRSPVVVASRLKRVFFNHSLKSKGFFQV